MKDDQKRNARPRSLEGSTPWSMRSKLTVGFALDMFELLTACIYDARETDKLEGAIVCWKKISTLFEMTSSVVISSGARNLSRLVGKA